MRVRLYVTEELAAGKPIALDREKSHYLFTVMRRGDGDEVRLFNGRQGEWCAELHCAPNRRAIARIVTQERAQKDPIDLVLLFSPLRKGRTAMVVEKACELGCRSLRPVLMQHSQIAHVNSARLRLCAIEAAEQCGLLHVPEIAEPIPLKRLSGQWKSDSLGKGRTLIYCDERGTAPPIRSVLEASEGEAWAILVGPEGGFSAQEAQEIREWPRCLPASLGPRLLRADTAAITALALLQALRGDWRTAG